MAPAVKVRDGTAADRDFVIHTAQRFAAFGPPPWRSAEEVVAGEARYLAEFFGGRVKGPLLLIATDEADARVGFALLEPAVDYFTGQPHAHLGMVAVTEAAEGSGAAAALLRAAEKRARAQGFARLTLNVFEGNARARRLYEREGFAVEIVRYVKALT